MTRTWWIALLVLGPVIGFLITPGSAQPALGSLGARCSSTVPCNSSLHCDTTTFGTTVGVCVDKCSSPCSPGQIADRASGCVCVAQAGPGRHCDATTPCSTGETCVTFTSAAFGAGNTPGGGVCVPTTTPTCIDGIRACPAGTKCAHTNATQGYCAPAQASPTAPPCRFDERYDASANRCVRLDPAGAACTGGCALAGASRSCVASLNKCAPTGMCAASETCGNNVDDDCNGSVDECTCYRVDIDGDRYCEPGPCQFAMAPGPNQVPVSACIGEEPARCDTNASHHPNAPAQCGTDTDCDGNASEGCPACEHSSGPFTWSCHRRTRGHCVQIHEAADPHTWSDNFLCSTIDFGLQWSSAGEISDMRCTRIYEHAEPAGHTWNDNWLCVPRTSPLVLAWSEAGPKPGWSCIQWDEPADPHAWADNYLCWKLQRPKQPCPANDKDCHVCPGPDKQLCCIDEHNTPACVTRQQCTLLRRPGKRCDPQRLFRLKHLDH